MRIAVLGATGGTGRTLVDFALANGHHVEVVARRPDALQVKHANLRIHPGDVRNATSLLHGFQGVDGVISCVGVAGLLEARKGTTLYSEGTRSIRQAMGEAGVRRLIVVSSSGTEPQPNDGWFFKNILKPIFLEPIYKDMRIMGAELRTSDLEWTIISPPYLTGGSLNPNYRTSDNGNFSDDKDLSRASLAHMLLDTAVNHRLVHKRVAVSD
jgi:putative NADH-flavin reductase